MCNVRNPAWHGGFTASCVGIAVENDTHAFDLHQFSQVLPNGWVLLGDLDRYVATTAKRITAVHSTMPTAAARAGGLSVTVLGAPSEPLELTALRPRATGPMVPPGERGAAGWVVVTKAVRFPAGCPPPPANASVNGVCVATVDF